MDTQLPHKISDEPAVESMPDAQLLAVLDANLSQSDQEELSSLLGQLREQEISDAGRIRLDDLISAYRRGMVRKARALTEAVMRKLRPGSSEDST